jgi:hypothetical protein
VVSPVDPEEDAPLFLFPAEANVEVKAHETTHVDLRCRAGGRIRITSVWPNDVEPEVTESEMDLEGPVPAPVNWLWPDPEDPQLTPILEPGRWTVVVTGDGLRTIRVPVDVHRERVAELTLRLQQAE